MPLNFFCSYRPTLEDYAEIDRLDRAIAELKTQSNVFKNLKKEVIELAHRYLLELPSLQEKIQKDKLIIQGNRRQIESCFEDASNISITYRNRLLSRIAVLIVATGCFFLIAAGYHNDDDSLQMGGGLTTAADLFGFIWEECFFSDRLDENFHRFISHAPLRFTDEFHAQLTQAVNTTNALSTVDAEDKLTLSESLNAIIRPEDVEAGHAISGHTYSTNLLNLFEKAETHIQVAIEVKKQRKQEYLKPIEKRTFEEVQVRRP